METLNGPRGPSSVDEEGIAAIAFALIGGLGPNGVVALVEAHGSALAALEAAREGRLNRRLPGRVRSFARRARQSAARQVVSDLPAGSVVIPYTSDRYPEGLRRLSTPPPVLFCRGPLAADQPRTVTVVGTRAATEYGRRMARRIAAELADAGWRVASGLARGIDAEAHRGALDAGGETVGVPGCGLRHVYPLSNRALYRDLEERGLLLTEFPPSERPRKEYFPRRNRILAGLARAVVVVQAGIRSGALITVDHASDIGVEVLAVPGPSDLPASRGVHELLRDGAAVATSANDVLSLLGEAPGSYTGSARASVHGPVREAEGGGSGLDGSSRPEDDRLLSVLTAGPAHVETLTLESGLPLPVALARLGQLELEGLVRGLPGGRFETVR